MKASIGILILGIGLSFISCKKDDPKPIVEEETATLYIKRLSSGDNDYTDFFFNTNNRLSKVMDNPSPKQMNLSFTYNTKGQLATMTEDGGETVNYNYNQEGVLTSSTSSSGFLRLVFEHEDNKIIRVTTYSTLNSSQPMGLVEFDYVDDNVIRYRRLGVDGSGNLIPLESASYEYDNKKNPFYECKIEQCMLGMGFAQFASKNNCIKQSTSDTQNQSYSISLEYNSANYPISNSDGYSYTYY